VVYYFLNGVDTKTQQEILNSIQTYSPKVYIYLDPPYSNTMAIYNESRAYGGWSLEDDEKLFNELDRITKLGVKWSLSNVLENKDKTNDHIEKWALKNGYKIIEMDRNYAALGKGVANSREVLILNYQPKFEQLSLFDFMKGE
jgi:adenine-specific DNA-methyltransferase